MKKSNDFDNIIYKYYKENNQVPQKITEAIWDVELKSKKKKISYFTNVKKVAITIISIISITTGIVFAKDISEFIKSIFNDSEGVDTATRNGYVYTAPEKIYSESDNTKTSITDLLMDDYTLDLNMIALFEEDIDVTGIEKINIPDIIITDDMNNILFSMNDETIKKYCQEKNLDYNNINKINTAASIFIAKANLNNMAFTYNLSTSENKFPKSKKIYIKFNTIQLEGNEKKYTITGNWENSISVPEKFYNRKSILYNVINCNNKNVYTDSIKAEVYETGMKFEMYMYWGDYKTAIEEMEEIRNKSILDGQLIKQEESYVENEYGEKFYPSQSSDTDGGYGIGSDGILIKYETFNLTKFDATDKLKVVFKTINDEEIIIELAR